MSDVFGNFMIGVVSLFFLSTLVFFMIGKSGMSSDIFNRTIYSTDVSGLDYIYLTLYTDGNVNKVNSSEYSLVQTENGVSIKYGFKRTFLPSSSSTATIPSSFVLYYDDCDDSGCYISKVSFDIDSRVMGEYYHQFDLNKPVYSGCYSNISFGAVLNSNDYEETVLDNNFYNITVPFCLYKPIDLSIEEGCIAHYCDAYTCDSSCNPIPIDNTILIKVANRYYDVEYVPILYYQENGEWRPIPLFNYTVVGSEGEFGYPYLTYLSIGEGEVQYLVFDITGFNKSSIKVELRLKRSEQWDLENEYEYDKNNNTILSFRNRMGIVFNGSTDGDYTVYNIGATSQAKVFTKIYSSSGEVIDQKLVELTYNYDDISPYRPYDIKPIYTLYKDGISNGVYSCPAVDVDGTYCFCPITNSITTYECPSGTYTIAGEQKDGSCEYNGESCTCSSDSITNYFLCMDELEPNLVSTGYFYKTVIKDEDLENNVKVVG